MSVPKGVTVAQYTGRCGGCDEPIEVGQEILPMANGADRWTKVRWVHVECPEAVPEKPTKFQGTTSEEMGF